VASETVSYGGKGQDFAVAWTQLLARREVAGASLPCALAQFVGRGAAGDLLLEQLVTAGVDCRGATVRVGGEQRVATTYVSTSGAGVATEIVGRAGVVSAGETAQLCSRVRDYCGGDAVAALAVMGSSPPGVDATYVALLITEHARASTRVLLDSVSALRENLAACSSVGAAAVLKLNLDELLALSAPRSAPARPPLGGEDRLRDGAAAASRLFHGAPALEWIAATDGARPGVLFRRGEDGQCRVFTAPPLCALDLAAINPIGAGDAVSAGLMYQWLGAATHSSDTAARRAAMERAFRFGLACGAASCCTPTNSVFAAEACDALDRAICVTRLELAVS
jgi:fructose-1-phosphate kinase PfkB-like protein